VNGEFLRGEIYWWRKDDSVGSEICARRPGVIVSSDAGNEKAGTVNIAYLTSQMKYGAINVEVACGERRSWVRCNQIETVDKQRALTFINTLDDEEMAAVDRAIMTALGLQECTEEEENPRDEKIEMLNEEIEKLKDELASAQHGGNVWKKMYEKALEDVSLMKYRADVAVLTEKLSEKPVEKKLEKTAEKIAEKPTEEEPSLVDINTCSKDDLRKLGCDDVLAKNIIARRPHKKVEGLRFVPGMKSVAYALLKARVCVSELPTQETTEKVNINTAHYTDIVKFLGISKNYAWAITGYRSTHGAYGSLEELKNTRLPKDFLERYGDKLTV
jgi:mRNA-degrading endonuclease toxin of MazEF toxin-antitoxin module